MRKRRQNAENQSWNVGGWCSETGVNVGGWVWKSQKITSAQTDQIIIKGTPEKKKGRVLGVRLNSAVHLHKFCH